MNLTDTYARADELARNFVARVRITAATGRDQRARRIREQRSDCWFIGVTGSCGKTTTKELISAVMAARYRGLASPDGHNCAFWTARTMVRLKAHHRYFVQEVGASGPGTLDPILQLLRPTTGIVTAVGDDHYSAFRSREGVAEEKGRMVEVLPPDGTAILNADDPMVAAMAGRTRARVVTYGVIEGADVRATEVTSRFPDGLAFRVHHDGRSVLVSTRLLGQHWVTAALAAIATGLVHGVPLEDAAAALAAVQPVPGRMSAEVHPDGVTFLRDDGKAPLWTVPAALAVLRDAPAQRRIAVIGTLSDFSGDSRRRYSQTARAALAFADLVVFVGAQAHCARRALAEANGRLKMFGTITDAAEFLNGELRRGDVVLLKASTRADHLGRLAMARVTPVRCWRAACGRSRLCHQCMLVRIPSGRAPSDRARNGAAPPSGQPEPVSVLA